MSRPFINVTVPVYNEEKELVASVERLVEFLNVEKRYPYEIVIADNGSTDRTQIVAEELSRRYSEVSVTHLPKPGRGRMLKRVWAESRADILSYMDVDLSTDLAAFWPLVESLVSGKFDLATGSRRLNASIVTRSYKREIVSRVYHFLVKTLFKTRFSDAQCGFKAITRKAATKLLPLVEDPGWLMDTELLILAEKLGYRLHEIPVRWVENSDSRVQIASSAFSALKGLLRLRQNFTQGRYS